MLLGFWEITGGCGGSTSTVSESLWGPSISSGGFGGEIVAVFVVSTNDGSAYRPWLYCPTYSVWLCTKKKKNDIIILIQLKCCLNVVLGKKKKLLPIYADRDNIALLKFLQITVIVTYKSLVSGPEMLACNELSVSISTLVKGTEIIESPCTWYMATAGDLNSCSQRRFPECLFNVTTRPTEFVAKCARSEIDAYN